MTSRAAGGLDRALAIDRPPTVLLHASTCSRGGPSAPPACVFDRHGRHPRSGRKALRLQPHRLRKFARKGLVSDDERELHDLWFREMLSQPCEALFRNVQVV